MLVVPFDIARVVNQNPDSIGGLEYDRTADLAVVQAKLSAAFVHQVELVRRISGDHSNSHARAAEGVGIGGRGNREGCGDDQGQRSDARKE